LKAHLALFSVALIYGANYTIAKDVMNDEYILPAPFVLMRAVFGAFVFWGIHRVWVKEKVAREDFPRLVLCGLFGVAINQLLFFEGLKLTTHINAALIMTINPIAVLIASAILLKEPVSRQKILGIGLGIVGAIMLIMYGNKVAFDLAGSLGDLMILINAISYGVYLVLVKPLMSKYHPITVVRWVFLFGSLMVIPFGFSAFEAINWSGFPTYIWAEVAYVLIFTTVLTYLLNAYALQMVQPSVVSIYVYLQPLLATFIALFLGKDVLTAWKVVAGIFIFTGVFFVSRKSGRIKISLKR